MLYLVTIYRPDGYDPAREEDDQMHREIDALNDEMVAAGVRVFVGGLQPVEKASAIHRQPNGQLSVTQGIYLKSGQHMGGLWVLKVSSHEQALEWGRKAAIACRANVEVRPFH